MHLFGYWALYRSNMVVYYEYFWEPAFDSIYWILNMVELSPTMSKNTMCNLIQKTFWKQIMYNKT